LSIIVTINLIPWLVAPLNPLGDQFMKTYYIPNLTVLVIWAKTDREALAIANKGWR